MPPISNPSGQVEIGYNGVALAGYFLQNYGMEMTGDLDQVSANGRVLTYITTNPGREYQVEFLVSPSANMDPPQIGQTVSLTIGATSTLPDEDSASPAAIEMICRAASIARSPLAVRMTLTLQWHPSAASDAAPMNFDGTAYSLT